MQCSVFDDLQGVWRNEIVKIRYPSKVKVMDFFVKVVKSDFAISVQASVVVEGDSTSATMYARPSVSS